MKCKYGKVAWSVALRSRWRSDTMKWKTTFFGQATCWRIDRIPTTNPLNKQRPTSWLYARLCYHIALYHHLLLLKVENSLISMMKAPRWCILYHFETPELLGKPVGSKKYDPPIGGLSWCCFIKSPTLKSFLSGIGSTFIFPFCRDKNPY